MPAIRPFRGHRYDTVRAGDPSLLLAPPYDVIDAAGRAELAARSPHNCVHVIVPEAANGSPEADAKYVAGAAAFQTLKAEALVRDDTPSIYVYHQRFEHEGRSFVRKGLVALIELTRFGEGSVLPHERTLAGPKLDRLKLMRACDAHLELVFGLFSDPDKAWESAVGDHLDVPVLEAEFEGAGHTLYRVSDPAAVRAVEQLLEDRKVYIADGHHRYETMCTFRDELLAAGRGDDVARWGMIYLSNLDDEGLVVRPTHRLVHGLPEGQVGDLSRVLAEVSPFFEIERGPVPDGVAAATRHMAEAGREGAAFGLALPGAGELVTLRLRPDFDPATAGLAGLHPALQRLDVALLHELVLERSLGITKEAQAAKTNLRYYKSYEDALAVVAGRESGDVQLVCLMNPTPVSDVVAVCDSGEVMPQKSTFFHPKIPTGLTFHALAKD